MPTTDEHDHLPAHRRTGPPAHPSQPDTANLPQASAPPEREQPVARSMDESQIAAAFAENMRIMASGLYLYGSIGGVFPQLETSSCVSYVTGMVRDAGDPVDPLERLLVEQLVQLHHAAGRLLMKAAQAGTPEASALLHAAAARMLGEYRRSLVTLRSLRQPPLVPTQVTVMGNIGQQNLASGPQHNAMTQRGDAWAGVESQKARLEGDDREEDIDEAASRARRSTTRRDREKKPGQVEGPHRRRPRALTSGGDRE